MVEPVTQVTLPTFDDVIDAALQINGVAAKTPLIESQELNDRVGGRVLLKPEILQRTGSFKFRGAYNRISRLNAAEAPGGIVAFSGGNHAQGAAAAAKLEGLPALVMMPANAIQSKVDATRSHGAKVIFYPPQEAHLRTTRARKVAQETGAVVVPSYDDRHVIAGQGTVGLEVFEAAKDLGTEINAILVPCSGGGLAAGCALVKEALNPSTQLFTVEPTDFDDTARSLSAGQRMENDPDARSICDALLMSPPGELTFEINNKFVTGGLSVTDDDVREAMQFAFQHLKLVVEPGGAVALASVLSGQVPVAGRVTAVVLSGGNVDPSLYQSTVFENRAVDRTQVGAD